MTESEPLKVRFEKRKIRIILGDVKMMSIFNVLSYAIYGCQYVKMHVSVQIYLFMISQSWQIWNMMVVRIYSFFIPVNLYLGWWFTFKRILPYLLCYEGFLVWRKEYVEVYFRSESASQTILSALHSVDDENIYWLLCRSSNPCVWIMINLYLEK